MPVRLLQQLRLLVLGGGVQPEAVRLHREVAAVLVEPALAHVEDLLAFEQRVDDDRPFLQCRRHVPTIGGSWMIRSRRETSDSPRTSPSPRRRGGRPVSCCVTDCPTTRGARPTVGTTYPELADHIAQETGFVVLTFNFRGTGTSEGDFSAAGWLDDLRAAVTALAARDGVRDGLARRLRARRHVRGVRSRLRRPRARCRHHRRRRAPCATGRATPRTCSPTRARWA